MVANKKYLQRRHTFFFVHFYAKNGDDACQSIGIGTKKRSAFAAPRKINKIES